MTRAGTLLLFMEELIASLILLIGAERRKHFIPRILVSSIISFLLVYFLPMPVDVTHTTWYFAFFREIYLVIIIFCVIFSSFFLSIKNIPIIITLGLLFSEAGQAAISICRMLNLVGNIHIGNLGNVHSFEIIFFSIYYVIFFLIFRFYKHKERLYHTEYISLNIIVVVICIINNILKRLPYMLNQAENTCLWIYELLFVILTIAFYFSIYYILNLQKEKEIIEQMNRDSYKRYEFTKETIDAVNVKCHDLKHELYSKSLNIEEKENIMSLVEMYDNTIHSGSPAIDYVLMDYKLRYKDKGIDISFQGGTNNLGFIKECDLVNFLTNALENAVEAVLKLEDPNKKVITINVEEKGDLIFFTIRNYFNGNLNVNSNDVLTIKEDKLNHGFGIKSMRNISKKYHGNLEMKVSSDIFTILVSFINQKS